eukprot:gene5836-6427_t
MQFLGHFDKEEDEERQERPSSSFSFFSSSSSSSSTTSRPGTSSGQRRLTTSSTTSSFGPTLHNHQTTTAILHRELGDDNLLRILNEEEIQLQTKLILLTEQGQYNDFKKIIEQYPRLDFSQLHGLHGYRLIHYAANRGHGGILAEILRIHPKSVYLQNELGETALHLAAYSGHLLIVDQLLDSGGDINALTKDGESALFYAARRQNVAIIRLLLQRGANLDLVDKYGEKAYDHAPNLTTQRAFESTIQTLSTPRRQEDADDEEELKHKNSLMQYLHHRNLLLCFTFLPLEDLLRSACVCRKWHMISGYDSLWKARGGRRWELALKTTLGFAPTATMSFLTRPRPVSSSSGGGHSQRGKDGGNGRAVLSRNNSRQSMIDESSSVGVATESHRNGMGSMNSVGSIQGSSGGSGTMKRPPSGKSPYINHA